MKPPRALSLLLLAAIALPGAARLRAAAPVRTVVLIATDNMRFSASRLEARPGQRIHLTLRNLGSLPPGHNWVLLRSDSEVTPYSLAAISARAEGYLPKALESDVIAAVPLVTPGESASVTFTCPKRPGAYPYICSCNGHALAGMRGVLVVD
jgi:azurin